MLGIKKFIGACTDVVKGVNATVWGGVEQAEKVGKIVKTGGSAADTIIGVDLALKDCARGDYFCTGLDVIGTICSATGMVLGNLPATKHLTVYTGSITVCCRTVRIYCQKYGTFWGCAAAVGQGVKSVIKYKIPITNISD
jgi:hypothetical protein